MADDKERPAFGGFDGGTAGTGEREAVSDSPAPSPQDETGDSLAAGDASTAAATGDQEGSKVAGTGGSATLSGRRTSEGVGEPSTIDPGDPGGMGGVTASTGPRGRPPGGVSPMPSDEGDD